MASQTPDSKQRHHCDHDGCSKSYLRVEHLNRHRLTHQDRAFSCYLCKRPFTRNDLLQAHIRRHEEINLDNVNVEKRVGITALRDHVLGDQHQANPRKRTKAGWDSGARPFAPPGEIDFRSTSLQSVAGEGVRSEENVMGGPEGFPLERVIFGAGLNAVGLSTARDDMLVHPEPQVDDDDLDPRLVISNDIYHRLVVELPQLPTFSSGHKTSLQRLFLRGFECVEFSMPLFHRPTCDISSALSESVILAVCSLGGIVDGNPDDRELSLIIYKHLQSRLYIAARDTGKAWLMANIPAVLIIEYVGYYALDYEKHVQTDITHAMTVMIFKQGKFLSQKLHSIEISAGSLTERWNAWVGAECKIRHAYSLFLAEVKSAMHFMRPSMVSTSMLDLPLPYASSIWQASTAVEWENELMRYNQTLMNLIPLNFQEMVALCLGQGDLILEYKYLFQEPFILDILIHVIASEILDVSRAIPTASSKAIDLLRRSDFANGLTRWKYHFDQMDVQSRETPMVISALTTYHLASILLREDISSLLTVCGTGSSKLGSTYFLTSKGDHESSKRGPCRVGTDAAIHAVKIIELYLACATTVRSFYAKRATVIACIVLTTYISKMKPPPRPEGHEVTIQDSGVGHIASQMLDLLEGSNARVSEGNSQYFDAVTTMTAQLVRSVRDHVATDLGDIAQDSCGMLDRVLESLS